MNTAISELLESEDKIDGIFFATNSISIAGVKALFRHNVTIQKDIQVMCFDESEAFNLLPFSVPFVKQPIQEMAKEALKLLIHQIKNEDTHVEVSCIDAQLIV